MELDRGDAQEKHGRKVSKRIWTVLLCSKRMHRLEQMEKESRGANS